MTVTFTTTGPAVDDGEVAAFEATLPALLPLDYRTFVLRQNGGEPELNWWPPETGVDAAGVRTFLSLGEVPSFRSLVQTRDTFTGRIPDNLLAIGYHGTGGQICVELAGSEPGSVWFYDPEYEFDEDEPPVPELLTRMCGSFDALLDILEPQPGLEEMRRRVAAAATRD